MSPSLTESFKKHFGITISKIMLVKYHFPCLISFAATFKITSGWYIYPMSNRRSRNSDFKFRYEGSLTTPECVEAVIWTIFRDPLVINTKTRDLILKTDSTKKVNNNFRTLMPVNDREGMVFISS